MYYREVLENATKYTPQEEEKKDLQLQPIFQEISPLQKRVSVSFYQEYYENIFFFLALEAGLNLVMDPELKKFIPPEKERITLQMKLQPLESILEKLCEVLDVSYSVDKGILKIQPLEERVINLGFIPVIKESKSGLGGDVLGNIGGDSAQTSSPLKGDYSIQTTLSSDTLDIYKYLEENLPQFLSEQGVFHLNRLTGFLYVKDRPSRVASVVKLISNYKKIYRKQIIIDAQIIEIELSKGHNLGVDWFEISNFLLGQNRVAFNQLDLGISPGRTPSLALTISGQPNINAILNLLREYGELKVISNPKIRVLHSQPALISVGTSQSFIKEVKRDVTAQVGTTTVQYTVQTSSIFDGVMLGITPFIAEDDEIYLHIVPIKSDLVDLREVKFGTDYIITLPAVNIREMSSIIRVKPNDLIVIGGLILDRSKNQDKKLGVPILEHFFSQKQGPTVIQSW